MGTPSISVITPTFNSAQTLDALLRSVREQDYPRELVEIVLGDGGSTDGTHALAEQYGARVIRIPPHRQHPEYNRGIAFNEARNELVLAADHDNVLPHAGWLRRMVAPLLEHPEVVAVETCWYHYDRSSSPIDRYTALFGVSEPLPYYLRKADRMRCVDRHWTLVGDASDEGDYFLVRFEHDPRRIPSVGTNGCLMRRKVVALGDVRPEYHFPVDVMVDVIKLGHDHFAFVKDSIGHHTGQRGLRTFLRRRRDFARRYHLDQSARRRWSVYMPGDEPRLALFVVSSVSLVWPLAEALRGFLRVRDPAWFLHPPLCLGTTAAYTWHLALRPALRRMTRRESHHKTRSSTPRRRARAEAPVGRGRDDGR